MATEFTTQSSTCEGHGCQEVADLTFSVKTKKKLCQDCIGKARGSLYCNNHDKEMELFCQTCVAAICYEGALKDHRVQACMHCPIDDVIVQNTGKLQDFLQQISDKGRLWRAHGDEIRHCRIDVDDYLKAVKDDVDSFLDEENTKVDGEERENAWEINEDFDERNEKLLAQIRENNRVRELKLEQNRNDAAEQRALGERKRIKFYADLQSIAQEVEHVLAKEEMSQRDAEQALDNAKHRIKDVLRDKKKIANEGNHVSAFATAALEKFIEKDRLRNVSDTMLTVRFAKHSGKVKYNGRIVRPGIEWMLMDEMEVGEVTLPAIVGCLDGNQLVITDRLLDNRHTYVLDMMTQQVTKVITGTNASYVSSCASLIDKIVTGDTRSGPLNDLLVDCVKVYDRKWKPIHKITIPLRRPLLNHVISTWVIVAVDQDEMVIAAEVGGHEIFVINPVQGIIVKTITCKSNVMISNVLESGDIFARPSPPDLVVLVIDRHGEEREISAPSRNLWNTFIDPSNNELYTVASSSGFKQCVINQLGIGRGAAQEQVVSFAVSEQPVASYNPYLLSFSRVMITASGDMIASDGGSILIFKRKLFSQ